MAGSLYIDLDREPLSSDECSTLVHNGSTGSLAFFGDDERIELMTVRYAVDAGTIVCYVPGSVVTTERAMPVTLEAFGESGSGSWSVVLKGRARKIVRDTDVKMVELLLRLPPGAGEIPLRVMADTMTGTRSLIHRPLVRPMDRQ